MLKGIQKAKKSSWIRLISLIKEVSSLASQSLEIGEAVS
jgi:hypothetical protein